RSTGPWATSTSNCLRRKLLTSRFSNFCIVQCVPSAPRLIFSTSVTFLPRSSVVQVVMQNSRTSSKSPAFHFTSTFCGSRITSRVYFFPYPIPLGTKRTKQCPLMPPDTPSLRRNVGCLLAFQHACSFLNHSGGVLFSKSPAHANPSPNRKCTPMLTSAPAGLTT